MAYRVSGEPPQGARTASSRKRGDRTLTRNAVIASVALGALALGSAGALVLGPSRDAGSLPNYVASHKALKLAWVDVKREADDAPTTKFAANVSTRPSAGNAPVKTARLDAGTGVKSETTAEPKRERVPLPHARPKQLAALV